MRIRQLLQGLGLHPGHELLLMHLWDAGPQRQADLAAVFDTDSASMSRTVQRVERAGFVRRLPDPNDGRVALVESTPAGLALRDRIERLWTELENDTVGELSPAKQRELLRGLQSLEASLSKAITADTALAHHSRGRSWSRAQASRAGATEQGTAVDVGRDDAPGTNVGSAAAQRGFDVGATDVGDHRIRPPRVRSSTCAPP
jgi:DNA-binding MarR family transcriptional regulator